MNKQRGFTLIEMLVVISIIGILAALVLVALNNARGKATDARIKSDIGQLRTLAEIHYDSNGASYADFNLCVGSGTTAGNPAKCQGSIATSVSALTADLTKAGGAITSSAVVDAFCVSSSLKSNVASFVCVDSTGVTTEGAQVCLSTSKCG